MVSLPILEGEQPKNDDEQGSCESEGGDRARCGNGLEKVYNTTAVRYGFMRHIGEFRYPSNFKFTCGAKTVIQTRRGIEIGEQVSVSCNGCDKHVSREQIKTYIANSGAESYQLENGRILREATADDLAENLRLRESAREMRISAQRQANAVLGPRKMKITECEFLLGGERAIFYFTSEGRVDFRNLVKDLSREFQTRIQMHQVGARDEARLLADFETCGREICCKVFLKTLKPISMRMAKLQRATLDPTKVSGRCGRLKCCLRYEHESYETMDAALPRRGEKVRTTHGYGVVVDRQILTQLVQVTMVGESEKVTVVIEDVLERNLKELPAKPEPVAPPPRRERSRRQTGSSSRQPSSISEGSSRRRPTNELERSKSTESRKGSEASGKSNEASGSSGTVADGNVRPESTDPPKRRTRRRRRSRRKGSGDAAGGNKPPAKD